MFSFIKKPIGFAIVYVVFSMILNKFCEYALVSRYATYAVSALGAVTFAFIFNYLQKVQLSEQFRIRTSYYVAISMFIIAAITIIAALFYGPEILGIKDQVEALSPVMVALVGLGSAALMSALFGAVTFLMITLGNLLSKSVVKNGTVL